MWHSQPLCIVPVQPTPEVAEPYAGASGVMLPLNLVVTCALMFVGALAAGAVPLLCSLGSSWVSWVRGQQRDFSHAWSVQHTWHRVHACLATCDKAKDARRFVDCCM